MKVPKSQIVAPEITEWTMYWQVAQGGTAKISARATGYLFPESWIEFNGRILIPNDKYKITENGDRITLEIINMQPSDEVTYTFCFRNMAGSKSENCEVAIRRED